MAPVGEKEIISQDLGGARKKNWKPAKDGMTPGQRVENLAKVSAKEGSACVQFQIKPLNLRTVQIPIIGSSPLICNRFGETAIKNIQESQSGGDIKLKTKIREGRVPDKIFNEARYINHEGRDSLRCSGIKGSIVESVRFLPGNMGGKVLPMTVAKALMQVLGELSPLVAPPPRMRTDAVRLESGVTSLAYRPEYWPWGTMFTLRYNADLIDEQGLFAILQLAGFHSGIHEWRPQRGGNYGMYNVANMEEFQKLQEEVAKWGNKVAPSHNGKSPTKSTELKPDEIPEGDIELAERNNPPIVDVTH